MDVKEIDLEELRLQTAIATFTLKIVLISSQVFF